NVTLLGRMKSWQRYAAVSVLGVPLGLGVRFLLQQIMPEDLARDAVALVRQEKEHPLSEPLHQILSDPHFVPQSHQPHPLLGQLATDFTLVDDQLRKVSLSELRGKEPVVLIFYYGYYCPHCVAQLFGMEEDLARFKELDARVVAVSADSPDVTAQRL